MKKKIQSVLCVAWLTAMLSTAASSFAETVQLAQLTVERFDNTISVTVPETIPEGLAKFYLVWDATDKGENAAAWAHRQAFDGEITSGGTCTFDATVLPTGYVYRVIGASDVELIDGYIALTGTQYIDTGVSAAYLNGFDLRFRYTESVNKGTAYLGDECVVIGSLYRTGEKTVNNISIRPNADDGKEKTQFKLFHRSRGPTSSELPEPSYFNFSDGNVNKLVEEEKVLRLPETKDEGYHYDINMAPHNHLICNSCGRIIDLFDNDYDDMLRKIEESNSIKITKSLLILEGICSKCKNSKQNI